MFLAAGTRVAKVTRTRRAAEGGAERRAAREEEAPEVVEVR